MHQIRLHPQTHEFYDFLAPQPEPLARDVVVQVEALSVNPIDTKRRNLVKLDSPVLGYDAVGKIVAKGERVGTTYQIGQRVMYAGTTKRAGSYQEYQAVNEHLLAPAPANLTPTEAASLPLVGLTAYELLFERMGFIPHYQANQGQHLLIINGAGGVGSTLSQLAAWSGLQVAATSSPQHHSWLQAHGVTLPLDYHTDWVTTLLEQWSQVEGIALLYAPTLYWSQVAQLIAPLGHIGLIVDDGKDFPARLVKNKAVSLDWEYMFAKTDFQINIASQGEILQRLTHLVEAGDLKPTTTRVLNGLSVATIEQAHRLVLQGHMVGKLVITVTH